MRSKKITSILLSLVMVFALCACGNSNTASYSKAESASYYDGGYTMEASGVGFSAYNGAARDWDADYEVAAEEAYYAEAKPVPAPQAKQNDDSQTIDSGSGDKSVEEMKDKIIYSSNVTLETTAFDDAIKSIEELVANINGYVETSSISSSNYTQKASGKAKTRTASYTLRIPSTQFNSVMNELGALGNIPYSHVYTENVTSQYYDTRAHMNAYKTQEARLLEMMEVAETVEDVITIEDRLTELRYNIESLQSQLNNWDRRVSYSTIYLEVQEVREYTPETIVNPTFWEELTAAFKSGFEHAKDLIKGIITWIAENGPSLIIWGLIIWGIVALVRFIYRKRAPARARRAEKRELKKAEAEDKQREARIKYQQERKARQQAEENKAQEENNPPA